MSVVPTPAEQEIGVTVTRETEANGATWLRACTAREVGQGEATVVPLSPPIAVFNVDGEFFATDDTCTHAESSLADGYIEGDVVECEFHYARFCIKDGAALSAPATEALRTYAVKVDGDEVFVDVSPRDRP